VAVETDFSRVFEALQPLAEKARERSQRLGRPVLATLTAHLGPLPAFEPASLVSQPDAFFWEQPHRGLTLAGAGQATRLTSQGQHRFRDVRDRLQRLLEDAVVRQESGAALRAAPLAFAGFAFDPQHPDDVAWFGFPDALVVLPRLLFTRSGLHFFVTANALVDGETDLSATIADLARDAARLIHPGAEATDADEAGFLDPGPEARQLWTDNVLGTTQHIAQGDAEKVVLARRVQVEAGGSFEPQVALQRLRERFRECTLFLVRAGDACFLGATPEKLVSLQGRTVRADCLAGSAARGKDDDSDRRIGEALLSDDKELREHELVARGLRENLGALCSDLHYPEKPVLMKMANVQHLHTPIEAVTNGDLHVLDLVERLHPTPATSGLPRDRSLQLIREQEPFSRGWYAGPIGWIDAEGGGEFAVALRSALLREDVASLYAGCGIVRGSDPDREYKESELKLEAMLWALNARK
jgi:isochorismate synthase